MRSLSPGCAAISVPRPAQPRSDRLAYRANHPSHCLRRFLGRNASFRSRSGPWAPASQDGALPHAAERCMESCNRHMSPIRLESANIYENQILALNIYHRTFALRYRLFRHLAECVAHAPCSYCQRFTVSARRDPLQMNVRTRPGRCGRLRLLRSPCPSGRGRWRRRNWRGCPSIPRNE